jgi:serine/threonine protein phosphatase PrpC
VAAVSDGHGGARHFRSQIGSSLAVSMAVSVLQEFLPKHSGGDGAASLELATVQGLQRKLVDTWLAAIDSDLEQHPLSEEELANLEEEDGRESRATVEQAPQLAYGATLLVAAASDTLLLFLQLGDGEILSVDATGVTTRPLPADDRLMGNQTTSLCQPDAWKEFRVAWVADPGLPALVLLTTDGYANSFRSDEDFLKIGQDYLGILREQGIATLAEELPEILAEATQQGSGDDITLALLQGELRLGASKSASTPVKPKISTASRSALIEQLKARHSLQQRKLDEFSSRLEQTRKDNRRLRALVALLILATIGAGVFFFRDRIFPHQPDTNPVVKPGTGSDGKHAGSPPVLAPGTKGGANTVVTAWTLTFNDGRKLILQKGTPDMKQVIIIPGGSDQKPYARVAELNKKIFLINDSDDTWTLKHGAGLKKSDKYPKYKQIELGPYPVEIDFTSKVTAKLTPVSQAGSTPSSTGSPLPPLVPSSIPPATADPHMGLNL